MVTACTTVDAGRAEDARRLVASLAEHHPGSSLSVLVLAREKGRSGNGETIDVRDEDFLVVTPADLQRDDLDVLGAAYPAADLAQALMPAMLRMLLAQNDHVIVLDRVARLTGSLDGLAAEVRAQGVLADGEGRLVGLARGDAATALLDAWDAVVASRAGVAAPLDAHVAHLPDAPPWELLDSSDGDEEATGWERTWGGFPIDGALREKFREAWRSGQLERSPYDPGGEQALFALAGRPASPPEATPESVPAAPEPLLAAARPFGVNLVGYLRAELGVAEVARQLIGALDAEEVPVLPIAIDAPSSRQQHAYPAVDQFASPFAVNLLCVNADQTPHVAADAGPDFFAGCYTVGLWWWEVSDFPEYFRPAFEAVDEVWAGSAFVADMLRAVSPKPVVQIPMPVTLPAGVTADRARFGFAGDEVTFLYVFDYNSVVERKNPLGLVEAYRRAFGDGAVSDTPTRLVLKCTNSTRHPEAHARVLEAVAGREDITIIDEYL